MNTMVVAIAYAADDATRDFIDLFDEVSILKMKRIRKDPMEHS